MPTIPQPTDHNRVKVETKAVATALGHTLSRFLCRNPHKALEYRALCTQCSAEVYVSYSTDRGWYRAPGWEIQHPCTGPI